MPTTAGAMGASTRYVQLPNWRHGGWYDSHTSTNSAKSRPVQDAYHYRIGAMGTGTNSAESGLVRDAYHYQIGATGTGTVSVPFQRAYYYEKPKIGTSTGCVPFQNLYYYESAPE